MILSYNERYDLFRIAYYNEDGKLIVELYNGPRPLWETSYMQEEYQTLTGFRNDNTHKNGITIIIHDDGEE